VRCVLEQNLEKALQRQQAVERQLAEVEALGRHATAVVDPQQVVDRLNRLGEVLARGDPTRGNLELSLHIDAIRYHQDGRVVVRTCKLGALAGTSDLLAQPEAVSPEACPAAGKVMVAKPRRRAVRRVGNADGEQGDLYAAAHAAAAVDRFAGLGPEWFWEETFHIPPRTCWSAEHAQEVARVRRDTGWSLANLAEHFGRSIPTIRVETQCAAVADGLLDGLCEERRAGRARPEALATLAHDRGRTRGIEVGGASPEPSPRRYFVDRSPAQHAGTPKQGKRNAEDRSDLHSGRVRAHRHTGRDECLPTSLGGVGAIP
jgi:hypothetical protein